MKYFRKAMLGQPLTTCLTWISCLSWKCTFSSERVSGVLLPSTEAPWESWLLVMGECSWSPIQPKEPSCQEDADRKGAPSEPQGCVQSHFPGLTQPVGSVELCLVYTGRAKVFIKPSSECEQRQRIQEQVFRGQLKQNTYEPLAHSLVHGRSSVNICCNDCVVI